jgi:murein DD-endopeptidase MepM/ murein hydrolase activator NlpD
MPNVGHAGRRQHGPNYVAWERSLKRVMQWLTLLLVVIPGTAMVSAASDSTIEARIGGDLQLKFHWPAKGRIVAAFCERLDHHPRRVLELAVALGADVHATEAGRVAYVGIELKGFRNVILIRHKGQWVSAYAFNDEVTVAVNRGDVVERGQVIAHTISIDPIRTFLSFELRWGSTLVDPLLYLEPAHKDLTTHYGCGH